MKGSLAAALLLAAAWVHAADELSPAEIEASERNRREYQLAMLEKRASALQVQQVVFRQQLLEHLQSDTAFTRSQCEQIAQGIRDPDSLAYMHRTVRELDKRSVLRKFTPEQAQRFAAVKTRIASLEEDASVDCRALVPIDP